MAVCYNYCSIVSSNDFQNCSAMFPSKILFAFIVGFLLNFSNVIASHLRAGEITVTRIGCTDRFSITVTVYIDSESGVRFGGEDDWLDFGDGDRRLIPEINTIPRPDLGKNMGMAVYNVYHVYSTASSYIISYSEPFRNDRVVNMSASGATNFYIETMVSIDPSLGCNENLPELAVPPIDKGCVGSTFFHNPYAFDRDGDRLTFELAVPKGVNGNVVRDYRDPNNKEFYQNYALGNEEKNGEPTFFIHPTEGTLTWDAPGLAGEYNVAFVIIEWRKDRAGVWRKLGSVTRDMQIIIGDCMNNRPDLIVPADVCVVAGDVVEATIFGTDPDGDDVKLEAFSEILYFTNSPATYTPRPPMYQPSTPQAQLQFQWQTSCDHVKEESYQVVFKITDNSPEGTNLVTFRTWRIKVVAPAPVWISATLEPDGRATVSWENYICDNADSIEVWRKVAGTDFTPANCRTGMPDELGYVLMAKQKLAASSEYMDSNLAPGAVYCYRLVATFPGPKGGESYVSDDICLEPIPASVPIITNVSVDRTDRTEGVITIRWTSPFDLDKTKYPGPYEYEVLRAQGSSGGEYEAITPPSRISDTTFVDDFLDTDRFSYHYKIVLYSNSDAQPTIWQPVSSSAEASSVWLDWKGFSESIQLDWSAIVPWSNQSANNPYHRIYRMESEVQPDFILIDSTHSVSEGLVYLDEGTFQSQPLRKDSEYCYRVLTRGTYGNPNIKEPLQNFSQRVCVTLNDEVRPCAPQLFLTTASCEEIFNAAQCEVINFSNEIRWQSECASDVRSYNVYASSGPDDEFELLAANISANVFTDINLSSFARCYRIKAVDAHGNESDWSEIVCNDNCPYFELPNVFSPNGDPCNEYFSAYGLSNPYRSTSLACPLGDDNLSKCLRFVDQVVFTVYNRWGKEVYQYNSGRQEQGQYINWDGKDSSGQWLSAGVYYYQAAVVFNTLDPKKRNETFKGWVSIVR
jgi:hypothetical protein